MFCGIHVVVGSSLMTIRLTFLEVVLVAAEVTLLKIKVTCHVKV